MSVNNVTIPQPGTANNAPDADGSPGLYQTDATLVPNPSKADGSAGTGSNLTLIPGTTPVPNPSKADGKPGTGTNSVFMPGTTQVPNPAKADGKLGTGSFPNGAPPGATMVPNPNAADGVDDIVNSNPPNPPPVNIIPNGAAYSANATYDVTTPMGLTPGLTYVVVFGPNEMDATMDSRGGFGGPYNLQDDTPFVYVGGSIVFDGLDPSDPVTAGLYLVSS